MSELDGVLAVLAELGLSRGDLAAFVLGWARALPTVILVPAFGLWLLPLSVRALLGASLAVCLAGAMGGDPSVAPASIALAAAHEIVIGVPIAVVASASVWAAVVLGGLADQASGTVSRARAPAFPGPLSFLLGLAACVAFLEAWGVERLVESLSSPGATTALGALTAGLDIGITVAVPILVVAFLVDAALLLAMREAPSLRGLPTSPLRAAAVLVVLAALLDGVLEALAGV